MRQPTLLTLVLVTGLLAACQGRVASRTGGSVTGTGLPASPTPTATLLTPGSAEPSSAPTPVVVASPIGSSLAGRVVLPSTLLSDAGATVIANHGAGLISNNGGAWRLFASDDRGLAGAEVVLADAAGQPVPGVAPVKSDATGAFAFNDVPPGLHTVLVHAPTSEGETASLRALAVSNPVDVTLASTLVTVGALTDLGGTPAPVTAATYASAVAGVAAVLQAPPASPEDLDAQGGLRVELVRPAGQVATLDNLAGKAEKLVSSLDDLGAEVTADLQPHLTPAGFSEVVPLNKIDDRLVAPAAMAVRPGTQEVVLLDVTTNNLVTVGPTGEVKVLAGNGTAGASDGVGTAASLTARNGGVAYAPDGLLYVTDYTSRTIRSVAPDGTVKTLGSVRSAGAPCSIAVGADGTVVFCALTSKTCGLFRLGADGKPVAIATCPRGPGTVFTADTFSQAYGLVLDAAGNAYLADYERNVVEKVTPAGQVTRFAGSGEPGFADGPATQARFRAPIGLAAGPDGRLFLADRFNYRIRAIAPDGSVTTVAGWGAGRRNGKLADARFKNLKALTLDAAGHLLVVDRGTRLVLAVR